MNLHNNYLNNSTNFNSRTRMRQFLSESDFFLSFTPIADRPTVQQVVKMYYILDPIV